MTKILSMLLLDHATLAGDQQFLDVWVYFWFKMLFNKLNSTIGKRQHPILDFQFSCRTLMIPTKFSCQRMLRCECGDNVKYQYDEHYSQWCT